jgi:hypothetical protein
MVVHPPPIGDFQEKAAILNCGRNTSILVIEGGYSCHFL